MLELLHRIVHEVNIAPNLVEALNVIVHRVKAAINADPIPSEPYYNLALLCSRDRRYEDARNYYQQALERGALPDPALEKKIAKP